jgi:hypothetical protein
MEAGKHIPAMPDKRKAKKRETPSKQQARLWSQRSVTIGPERCLWQADGSVAGIG